MIWIFLAVLFGYMLGSSERLHVRRKLAPLTAGLPCPNTPCRNVIPRRGTWDGARRAWAIEKCPVCDAAVTYVSSAGTNLSANDCYVRVAEQSLQTAPATETDDEEDPDLEEDVPPPSRTRV